MDWTLSLVIAAALGVSSPLPLLAEDWPGAATAEAPTSRALVIPSAPNPRVAAPQMLWPVSPPAPILKIEASAATDLAASEPLDVRPKDAWTDDQGFSLTRNRLAFKRRF